MAAGAFEALAGTRPRIRRDVLFTETPGGVLFHNADGGFHLTGRTAYRFASLLVPHLAGEHRLADICDGFGPAQQTMAAELVKTLYARGFARDIPGADSPPAGDAVTAARPEEPGAALPAPAVPDAAVSGRFAAQIGYIDHYTDAAPARFQRFRDTRVAVLGDDETARWAALSLVRNGCGRLGVTYALRTGRLAEEVGELTVEGCPVQIDALDALDDRDALVDGPGSAPAASWDGLEDYDVVLVTGPDAAARTHALLTAGVPEGRTVIPSWTFGERAVTGPLNTAGTTGCWCCALLRLGANVDAGTAAELWSSLAAGAGPLTPAADGPLNGPVAAMTGNLLGYEIFRLVTGALPAETDRQVLIQDLASLDVLAEPVQPHPRCRLCPGTRTAVGAGASGRAERVTDADTDADRHAEQLGRVLADGPALPPVPTVDTAREAEELVERLQAVSNALVRPHTGTFTRYDDEELTQTPLKVSRIEVPLGHGVRRTIAAFDVHHLAGARTRALHTAAGVHVEHVVPLETAEVMATSLLTKEPVPVPSAAVRTFGPYNRDRRHPASSGGTGAGGTPQEAAGDGLLSALAYEALLHAVRGSTRVRLLAAEPEPAGAAGTGVDAGVDAGLDTADPELVFLLKSARNLGVRVELLDLGESARSSAHVVLARETGANDASCGGRWATGGALSRTAAARAALRELLGAIQLADEQPETDGRAVDTGDPLLAELDPGTVRVSADGPEDAGDGGSGAAVDTTFDTVLDRLRAAGRDVLLVPTTPAALLAAGISTCRVLLTPHLYGGADAHR